MRILVTGANGQLGSEIRDIANEYPGFEFIFGDKEELDITSMESVNLFFAKNALDFCVNCAAYTAVDKAETEKEAAMIVNAKAVEFLAGACSKHGVKLIHISTDYVFPGTAVKPYQETDEVSPVNFYGETKLKGELAVNAIENSMVIRTSWVYSFHGKNFVKTMLKLMSERESLGVVSDQFGCPTYAADLAKAILEIIKSGKFAQGTYHYCNSGVISWHRFADAIKEILGSKCVVNAITTADYPTPAARPAYSALSTAKIAATYHLSIPVWRDSLEVCIKKLTNAN